MRRGAPTALATAPGLLAAAGPVAAEETDAGHYTPGAAATIIDLPPTKPGFVIQPIGLHYRGDVSVSNDFPIAGTVAAGLEAQADVVTLGALYTFEERVLGAFYTVGAYVPVADVEVTAFLSGPLGRIERTDRVSGLGDITLVPALLAWKRGEVQYGVSLPVYAPTGAYDSGRLANIGQELLDRRSNDPRVLQRGDDRL